MPKPKSHKIIALPPVMHIYCEGANTEPLYIRKYIDTFWGGDRRRELIRLEDTKKNTPVQLVEVAVKHKQSASCPPGDTFWVVYDRESTAKYDDSLHLEASSLAKANDINLAISNVCFELWLLLHFKSNNAPFKSYDDLILYSDLRKELKKIGIADYDKSDVKLFSKIKDSIGPARKRALQMNKATLAAAPKGIFEPYRLNPFTDVPALLDAIDIFK